MSIKRLVSASTTTASVFFAACGALDYKKLAADATPEISLTNDIYGFDGTVWIAGNQDDQQ